MARTVTEWRGRTDDSMPHRQVRDRISAGQGDKCACCPTAFGPGQRPQCDHIIPLRDGGENRESNMQMLCVECHKAKTKAEATVRTKVNAVRQKHLGIRMPARHRFQSQGFPKAPPQHSATREIVRKSERTEP